MFLLRLPLNQPSSIHSARSHRPDHRCVALLFAYLYADDACEGIVFTMLSVRLTMRNSKTWMTTMSTGGDKTPMDCRIEAQTTVDTEREAEIV